MQAGHLHSPKPHLELPHALVHSISLENTNVITTFMRRILRHQAAALANRHTFRPASTMASQPVRRSHIEVERKFVPTALLQAQLDGKYGEYERLRRLQPGANAEQHPSMRGSSPLIPNHTE